MGDVGTPGKAGNPGAGGDPGATDYLGYASTERIHGCAQCRAQCTDGSMAVQSGKQRESVHCWLAANIASHALTRDLLCAAVPLLAVNAPLGFRV
jgi:hypothetical protein